MDNELETSDNELEISAADLGLGATEEVADDIVGVEVVVTDETLAPAPTVRAAPKAWPKEMHEHWGKVDPAVQDYLEKREQQMAEGGNLIGLGKRISEVVTPFRQMLQAQGVDEAQAVQYLLGAHHRLTQGTPESRRAAYDELGRNLGFTQQEQQSVDPALQQIKTELQQMKSSLTARQEAELNEAKGRVAKEVEAFASDKEAHPYFDDVAEDLVPFLNAGQSLQDAYEKAVWANPVTRAKEQARLTAEHEKKLKENQRLDALKAKKGTSANVRARETSKAPTEPLGSMEETMRETLRDISTRTH